MFEKEFDFYLKNQSELAKKFGGRYLVIKGEEILGDYLSEQEAYIQTKKTNEIGTFLIQKCTIGDPTEEGHTQIFHSRVSFA